MYFHVSDNEQSNIFKLIRLIDRNSTPTIMLSNFLKKFGRVMVGVYEIQTCLLFVFV